MSDIGEKTKIPVGWAATIIATIIGLAFNVGVAHYRLQILENELGRHDASEALNRNKAFDHELRLQKLDISLTNIEDKLTSIDKKLDNIEARRQNGR